jgi:hypothetical protein
MGGALPPSRDIHEIAAKASADLTLRILPITLSMSNARVNYTNFHE